MRLTSEGWPWYEDRFIYKYPQEWPQDLSVSIDVDPKGQWWEDWSGYEFLPELEDDHVFPIANSEGIPDVPVNSEGTSTDSEGEPVDSEGEVIPIDSEGEITPEPPVDSEGSVKPHYPMGKCVYCGSSNVEFVQSVEYEEVDGGTVYEYICNDCGSVFYEPVRWIYIRLRVECEPDAYEIVASHQNTSPRGIPIKWGVYPHPYYHSWPMGVNVTGEGRLKAEQIVDGIYTLGINVRWSLIKDCMRMTFKAGIEVPNINYGLKMVPVVPANYEDGVPLHLSTYETNDYTFDILLGEAVFKLVKI